MTDISSDKQQRSDTPDVNRALYCGRVQQNDGFWLDGGEWVRAEDARVIERARNEIARQFNELMDAKERIREERDRLARPSLATLEEGISFDDWWNKQDYDLPFFYACREAWQIALVEGKRRAAISPRATPNGADAYDLMADAVQEIADAAEEAFKKAGLTDPGEWDSDNIVQDVKRGIVSAIERLAALRSHSAPKETIVVYGGEKSTAASPASNQFKFGILFRSAASGGLYTDAHAAGDISEVWVKGKIFAPLSTPAPSPDGGTGWINGVWHEPAPKTGGEGHRGKPDGTVSYHFPDVPSSTAPSFDVRAEIVKRVAQTIEECASVADQKLDHYEGADYVYRGDVADAIRTLKGKPVNIEAQLSATGTSKP